MPATLVRCRTHRGAARTAGHRLRRQCARRAHRHQHARRRVREYELNANATVGDYGTYGANGVSGWPRGRGRIRVAPGRRQLSQRRLPPQRLPRSRRHQRLRRDQRALQIAHAAVGNAARRMSPRCGWISTTATTRSRSTIPAPRCPTSPGRIRSSRARWRCALDYTRRRCIRRREPHQRSARRAASIPSTATGATMPPGARTRPTTTSSASIATARTLSEDLRIVSRDNVDRGAEFAWLAGVYALRTDEDVQQHDVYHDLVVRRRRASAFDSDYRATNLAALRRARVAARARRRCSASVRAASIAAPTTAIPSGADFFAGRNHVRWFAEPAPRIRRARAARI